ncbi:MAG: murein biosynthesis integral membrane protein MurJ [Bryobacteraceae bacterium]|nr:murein biosynthesis integral membrane protein MurJ [Bryobacteraceae bacterium]
MSQSLSSADPKAPDTPNSVVKSAGIVSIAVFSSRITGLVREQVLAALFGASQALDAYRIGFLIPNLTRDLFAEGALSSAFVPIFTEYLSSRSREEAARLANLVASAIILVVGTICILGVIFSPFLVAMIAPGFLRSPGKFELAVQLTRIMFPFLLMVALAAQAMGILNACNRFAVPATASTMFNIGSLIAGLFLGKVVGPHIGLSEIHGMAWGAVTGGVLQLAWQIPSLRAAGFHFQPTIDWSDPGLRRIALLMGPAILGNAAVQINVTVNNNLASHLGDGAVSWLQFAFRFMQLPIGIFGVAIASATLPAISRSASLQNIPEFRATLSRSLGMVFLLTVPSAVGLAVLGRSIVAAVYQHGAFQVSDTEQTSRALSWYALGLIGYAAIKVINPAFYALKDSRTPMMISFGSIVVNLVVALCTVKFLGWGHSGLALSTSAVAIFSAVALFVIMRNRIGGIYGRNLWSSFVRITAASCLMGVAVYASSLGIHRALGEQKLTSFVDLGVSIPLGMAVLWISCRLIGVPELDSAAAALAGPLRRRIPFLGKGRPVP